MGKRAKIVPRVIQEEVVESDDSLAPPSEVDSDDELISAYEKGELQPGLNTLLPYRKKEQINNVQALKSKLAELSNDFEWVERLDMVNEPAKMTEALSEHFGDIDLKINKQGEVSAEEKLDKSTHDFKREMLFYRQAQAAVLMGIPKLKKLGVPTKRPEDYFAQMLKTDEHMKKVRQNLIAKQESLDKSAKAKKMREMKKLGKAIQNQVLRERADEKREMLNKVQKFRKGKTNKLELDAKPKKIGKKKLHKDKVYGYGGQKKRSKYNTAESAAEIPGRKRGGGARKKKPNRPGKQRRRQQRASQK